MSNLNDFTSNEPRVHIRSLRIGNAMGSSHGSYDAAKSVITLHADTKLIKLSSFDTNTFYISYTLDGSAPDVGDIWENSSSGSPNHGKYIAIPPMLAGSNSQGYLPIAIKVNGGETFKYMRVGQNGQATADTGGSGIMLEEWGY